jgi:hypothetical protein
MVGLDFKDSAPGRYSAAAINAILGFGNESIVPDLADENLRMIWEIKPENELQTINGWAQLSSSLMFMNRFTPGAPWTAGGLQYQYTPEIVATPFNAVAFVLPPLGGVIGYLVIQNGPEQNFAISMAKQLAQEQYFYIYCGVAGFAVGAGGAAGANALLESFPAIAQQAQMLVTGVSNIASNIATAILGDKVDLADSFTTAAATAAGGVF